VISEHTEQADLTAAHFSHELVSDSDDFIKPRGA